MLKVHERALFVDCAKAPAGTRRKRKLAPFVEEHVDAGVPGLAQIATLKNATSIDAIGKGGGL
jgi:hypothetical protein